MKYCIVIIDGAAGVPVAKLGGKTSLEAAKAPNLDEMTQQGVLGMARTVPPGMEPGSANACMSVLGYDPAKYYGGRAAIEARSLGIPVGKGETVFRCNLVAVNEGRMWSYSSGHITSAEGRRLIEALNEKLGNSEVEFFPGVGYRHILKIKGSEAVAKAVCTPPHDIPDQLIAGYLPKGPGSEMLLDLMKQSEEVLRDHPVNVERRRKGLAPATTIWLFWGCGQVPEMPPFKHVFGLDAAMTTGVDLLRGLALMAGMSILELPGITDNMENDFAGQAQGALDALNKHDLVVVHVEAPDEAGHGGNAGEKVAAIEKIDAEVFSRIRKWQGDSLRVLVMPDHPTPLDIRTHTGDPVPFLVWGKGFKGNGAQRFTEAEGTGTGVFVENAYNIMGKVIEGKI